MKLPPRYASVNARGGYGNRSLAGGIFSGQEYNLSKTNDINYREAAKKVIFIVAGPLRGSGGGGAKRLCHVLRKK